MARMMDFAKGICLSIPRVENKMLWAVSGLNLKSIGLRMCLYMVSQVISYKYNQNQIIYSLSKMKYCVDSEKNQDIVAISWNVPSSKNITILVAFLCFTATCTGLSDAFIEFVVGVEDSGAVNVRSCDISGSSSAGEGSS